MEARPDNRAKPLVAVVCHGQVFHDRPAQYATEAFLAPVAQAGGSTLLVPALPEVVDIKTIARVCDALLLTGSQTNVSPQQYGCDHHEPDANPDRDAVSLNLAEAMISAGRPVLGICLGMQELAVLYGSTLRRLECNMHMAQRDWRDVSIFGHKHDVDLVTSRMVTMAGASKVPVVSAHRQAICQISSELTIEAEAEDGTIEAFRADEIGRVTGVQWHPERMASALDAALFRHLTELA